MGWVIYKPWSWGYVEGTVCVGIDYIQKEDEDLHAKSTEEGD